MASSKKGARDASHGICAGSLEARLSDSVASGCCTMNPFQERARISTWLHFCQLQVRLGTVCKCSQVQSCARFLKGFDVHRPVGSLLASGASQDPARIMSASAPCQKCTACDEGDHQPPSCPQMAVLWRLDKNQRRRFFYLAYLRSFLGCCNRIWQFSFCSNNNRSFLFGVRIPIFEDESVIWAGYNLHVLYADKIT